MAFPMEEPWWIARIAELEARNRELVEGLTEFAGAHDAWQETDTDTPSEVNACARMMRANDKARALLTKVEKTK